MTTAHTATPVHAAPIHGFTPDGKRQMHFLDRDGAELTGMITARPHEIEFLVHAVESHDDLVKALFQFIEWDGRTYRVKATGEEFQQGKWSDTLDAALAKVSA